LAKERQYVSSVQQLAGALVQGHSYWCDHPMSPRRQTWLVWRGWLIILSALAVLVAALSLLAPRGADEKAPGLQGGYRGSAH